MMTAIERVCSVCDGMGIVTRSVPLDHPDFGKTFPCPGCSIHEERRQESIMKMSHLDTHADKTFATFMTDVPFNTEEENRRLSIAQHLAMDFVENPTRWLVLHGRSGAGKTHLAAAVGHEFVLRSIRTIFVTTPDLLDHLRATFGPTSDVTYDQQFDTLCKVPVLILDDLGAENQTPWAQEKLYQLINHRYNATLPTIITTNVDPKMMDERVASRLGDLRRVVNITLNVPDFRREGEATSNNDLKALSNLTLYQDKTFESFNISSPYTAHLRPEIHRIQHYADDPNDHWLLVIGGHGAGKTHLAAAVANYWSAMHGKETVLVNTADLLDFLRATFSPDSNTSFSTRFQLIREIPLLLLDDFQVSSKTPVWSREKLFQLIDYRYLAKLPTVFASTRAHFQELKEAHPHIYSRIFDRSLAVVVMLENTKDYRLLEV